MEYPTERIDSKTVRGVVRVEVATKVPVDATGQEVRLALRGDYATGKPEGVNVTDYGHGQ